MKTFNTIKVEKRELKSIICDKCKVEYTDIWEIQEFLNVSFTAGYASILGDGKHVSCDICQTCFKDVLGKYLKIEEY